MREFRIQEADLEIPEEWVDKTTNIFAAGTRQPPTLGFVITRDDLDANEDFAAFVDTKLDELLSQLDEFKIIEKRQLQLSNTIALDVEFTWRSGVGLMYQRQTYVHHHHRVLVFTATSKRELRTDHREQIDAVLASLRLKE